MKIRRSIIYFAVTIFVLSIFSCNNKQEVFKNNPNKVVASSNQTNIANNYFEIKPSEMKISPLDGEISLMVQGRYTRPILKEKLIEAELITDIIQYSTTNWVEEFISVEISTISNADGSREEMKAISPNQVLTADQKELLNAVDLASEVIITIKYKTNNLVTGKIENGQLNVSMTVIPEIEAEFIGGYDQIIAFLKENISDKVIEMGIEELNPTSVIFTVNEAGKTDNVILTRSSGDYRVDRLLVESITNMPNWKPATNKSGKNVKQEFEFYFGSGGC